MSGVYVIVEISSIQMRQYIWKTQNRQPNLSIYNKCFSRLQVLILCLKIGCRKAVHYLKRHGRDNIYMVHR